MSHSENNISKRLKIFWNGNIPNENDSYVSRKSYELIYKELEDFTAEDLRFLISQNKYLDITVPMALALLKNDFFLEAYYYRGDLLKSILEVGGSYWKKNLAQADYILDSCKEYFGRKENLMDFLDEDSLEEIIELFNALQVKIDRIR